MQWSLIFESLCRVLWSTAPDVYAVVRCETDAIRSRVFKAEGNPEFNLRAIFYRRYPDAHISIEVWHIHISIPAHASVTSEDMPEPSSLSPVQLWSRGPLRDSALGGARLRTAESERSRSHVMDLRGHRGRVHVETSSSVCLTDLWQFKLIDKLCRPKETTNGAAVND